MSECRHDIVIKDMCADCGKDLREEGGRAGQRKEQATANVSMIHHVPELVVSDSTPKVDVFQLKTPKVRILLTGTLAKEIGSADETNLIKTRKLVLLVDLDQTVIHTSDKPLPLDAEKHKDITKYNLHSGVYTTKLRPHTTEFLNEMAAIYEMHIVTYGQREYAHKIAQILDPDERLFGQRILSRNELCSAQHKTKNLKALFPCGDNLVVIIDDRADVWQYSEALIQIKPYRFFKEIGDINAPNDSEEQIPAQIEDGAHEDRVLEDIEKVLTNIHDKYYEKQDLRKSEQPLLDVKDVIKDERHKVLDGCVIVFSGIVATGEKLERTDIYRVCVQFGATIVPDVVEGITHVVGARYGTQKVHQAHRLRKFIVTVQWVYACVEKWMQADEKQFELTKESTPPVGRPLGSNYVKGDSEKANVKGSTEKQKNKDAQNRGLKRKQEMDNGEEESDSAPMSYKALLSRLRREGRNVSEHAEDAVYDVDDGKGHVAPTNMDDDDFEDNEDEEVQESDDDDEFEEMAALVERQISEAADEKDNE